jgi:hypothetical protein
MIDSSDGDRCPIILENARPAVRTATRGVADWSGLVDGGKMLWMPLSRKPADMAEVWAWVA